MKRLQDYVIDREGNAVAGAEVHVRKQSDSTLATIYSDDGVTTKSNPTTTDNDGEWFFYAADDTYKFQVYVDGVQQNEVTHVQHYDLSVITTAAWSILDDATVGDIRTTLGVGTGDSPQFTAINLGHASDTTITRTGAGDAAIEGNLIYRAGGTDVPITDGGTGASSAADARTNLEAAASGANTDITSVYLDNTGLKIKDTNASHGLTIAPGSNLTEDRTLTVTTGDAARTLDISAASVTVSAFGATLVDDADAATARATLGIGAGSGLWVLIETLSPSAVASIDSEGFAGGSYTELRFSFDLAVSADGAQLQARYKLNGSYVSAANYRHGSVGISSSGSTNTVNSQTGTEIRCTGSGATWGIGNASLEHATGELIIATPFSAATAKHTRIEVMHINANGGITQIRGGGTFDGTDAEKVLQGLRFLVDTGTMTGSIKVYGRS